MLSKIDPATDKVTASLTLTQHPFEAAECGGVPEDALEILSVVGMRMSSEVALLGIARLGTPDARTRNVGLVDQPVVLAESDEHARQEPGDSHLREAVVSPLFERSSGPVRIERGPPFGLEASPDISILSDLHVEVGDQTTQLALQLAQ